MRSIQLLCSLLIVLLPAIAGVAPIGLYAQAAGEYLPDEIVLKLYNAADLGAVASDYGLNPAPLDQFGSRPIFRLRISDGSDPQEKATQIKPEPAAGDLRVEFAEPNYLAQDPESRRRSLWVIGGDSGTFAAQWAPETIRLAAAHAQSRGAGVTVAVLDTGVDPTHPALAGHLSAGFDFVDFDADPREEGIYGVNPGFGHGTHVAGLIALTAPEAKIMPVRVLDEDGIGNLWVLTEGLIFAAEHGPDGIALSGDEARVINLSLGTLRRTNLLEDIIGEITCRDDDDDDDDGGSDDDDGIINDDDDDDDDDRCVDTGGVVVIAAAGNGGNNVPQYPAAESVEGMLAVSASTANDNLAAFSTYGSWIALTAPGEAIVSAIPDGKYATWSGTSMAAPLVAGVAALVRSADSQLDAVSVTRRLAETGHAICGPVPVRLDAAAALGAEPSVACDCSMPYRVFLPSLTTANAP
ncbi:MAG: S8 family serine peptidase [Oscillochloris sp.]|nr:S8 family serine peptidase [Oscillochloris sp.]